VSAMTNETPTEATPIPGNGVSDINNYGELATWDTTSLEYREKISQLVTQYRPPYSDSTTSAYQAGLLTWEHARAQLGMVSDPSDPRWGRFFVSRSQHP
jgi:hypothetical protein